MGRTRVVERRGATRLPLIIRVDYAAVDEVFTDFTENINEGGMFIQTTKKHAPGTPVRMEFTLPGASVPVRVTGKVVWAREDAPGADGPPGIGVQFDMLPRETKDQINEIVRSLRAR